jgi:hypothetical protein
MDLQGDKQMSRRAFSISIGALAAAVSFPSLSAGVPNETGWNGFVQLGYSYNGIENNEVAGIGAGNYKEFTPESIDSIYASPDEVTEGLPAFNFKLSYTFDSRTELFAGRELVDAVRFDFTQQVGVRQELNDKSNVSAAYVFSGIPTKVWEDPFVQGQKRTKTDRDSQGIRLTYGDILGSRAQLQYTYRKIDIDNERSGQFLGLTPAETKLLKRDGDEQSIRAGYLFELGDKESLLPEVIYVNDDRDGDAVSSEQWGMQVTYANRGERFNLALTGSYVFSDFDKRHPIYGKTREDDNWGFGASLFDKRLLSSLGKDWWATATAGYYQTDSNINFYNSTLWTVGVGAMYRF